MTQPSPYSAPAAPDGECGAVAPDEYRPTCCRPAGHGGIHYGHDTATWHDEPAAVGGDRHALITRLVGLGNTLPIEQARELVRVGEGMVGR